MAIKLKNYALRLREQNFIYESDTPIKCSADIAELLFNRKYHLYDRELSGIILLDSQGDVKGISEISIGTLTEALVHPREVFKVAIYASAAAIVFFHNHPSGSITPSASDISTTRNLKEAGKILQIKLLDSIILGSNGDYCSMRDEGCFNNWD